MNTRVDARNRGSPQQLLRQHYGPPREAGSISDKDFFQANPGRDYRLRLATQPEAARIEQHCGPVPRDWFVYTVTKQFFLGFRLRRYCVGLLTGPWSEGFAKDIFERLEGANDAQRAAR